MWLFILPFLASALAFVLPASSKRGLKGLAFLMSLIPLALLIYNHQHMVGSSVNYAWFPVLSIHFHLSVDSLSHIFLYLTAIVVPFSILSVKSEQLTYPNAFYGIVLLLQGLLIGFFTARDLVLFTIFWESIILPLFLMINLWGGNDRKRAALQFLIYMVAGSFLLVAAVLALYLAGGTFDIDGLLQSAGSSPYIQWIAAIFFLAFAVKTPLFPFHAWLPDAYTQASTPGSILLSALLSKAGIYGFLRIGTELFPKQMESFGPLLLTLAIIGVFWGALSAWVQTDFKRLIAYSSFSHVNFVLVGIFVWNQTGETGSILQAFNHGITITALFLVSGWLEDRLGTTEMSPFSGLAKFLPKLCWITLFFVLSSVALPGLNNFVGEVLILFSVFIKNRWLGALLGLTVILSVVYMLRWMQKLYFETPNSNGASLVDLRAKEILIALPLMALILWIGLYPTPVLKEIEHVQTVSVVDNTRDLK